MNYLSKSSLCLLAVVTSLTATAQETLSDKFTVQSNRPHAYGWRCLSQE